MNCVEFLGIPIPSLTWLARASGVSLAHLSRVAAGERKLSGPSIVRVARALGVPASELFARMWEGGGHSTVGTTRDTRTGPT